MGLTILTPELGFVDLGTKGLLIWVVFSGALFGLCFSIRFLCCVLWVGLQWEMGLKKLESYRLEFHIKLDCKQLDLLWWSRALKTWDASFLNSLETLLTNEIVWEIRLGCNFSQKIGYVGKWGRWGIKWLIIRGFCFFFSFQCCLVVIY